MKASVLLLIGLCGGIAGTVLFLNARKTSPAPAPAAETTPAPKPIAPEIVVIPKPIQTAVATSPEPTPAPATNSVPEAAESEATVAFRKTIDALLSATVTPREKHELFQQLGRAGQLDQAITELKRRMTDDPGNPEIPTTLGEAMLNKVRILHESGADVNEVGILAMQADQSFNAALKLDPANWEAQFVKYSTMYYWPANEARDNEIAQHLSSLIDQQESLPQQPQFAQTYVVLGNQYQKLGKSDFAIATWQLGLTRFPGDPTLVQKLATKP